MKADSLLALDRCDAAAEAAQQAFATNPCVNSFAILFQCAVLDDDTFGSGQKALKVRCENNAADCLKIQGVRCNVPRLTLLTGLKRFSKGPSGATSRP